MGLAWTKNIFIDEKAHRKRRITPGLVDPDESATIIMLSEINEVDKKKNDSGKNRRKKRSRSKRNKKKSHGYRRK